MKGQCNSSLYTSTSSAQVGNLVMLRQSGDIDIHVDGGRESILDYVKRTVPTNVIKEIEMEFKIFDVTEVDMYYGLSNLRHPFRNKKLHAYLNSLTEKNLDNMRT